MQGVASWKERRSGQSGWWKAARGPSPPPIPPASWMVAEGLRKPGRRKEEEGPNLPAGCCTGGISQLPGRVVGRTSPPREKASLILVYLSTPYHLKAPGQWACGTTIPGLPDFPCLPALDMGPERCSLPEDPMGMCVLILVTFPEEKGQGLEGAPWAG